MPNPAMRDARAAALKPTPTFTTDVNGTRQGPRPTVGPASPDQIHAALKAQDALASAPRPVAQSQVGSAPADNPLDNPTRDLSLSTAASRLAGRTAKVNQAIDDASQ